MSEDDIIEQDGRRTPGPYSDLKYAFADNPQEGITFEDVVDLVAQIPGENDELNWYWVAQLADGRWALFTGSCDDTGWGCQSSLEHEIADSALGAAMSAPDIEPYSRREIRAQLVAQVKHEQPYAMHVTEVHTP